MFTTRGVPLPPLGLFVKGKIFWGDGIFAWVVRAGLAGVGENLRSLELELLVKRELEPRQERTLLLQGPLRSDESLAQIFLLRTMVISEKCVGVVPRDSKGLAVPWSMKLGGHVTVV